MGVDREELERQALEAVSAEYYYELLDCISEADDAFLKNIIAGDVVA